MRERERKPKRWEKLEWLWLCNKVYNIISLLALVTNYRLKNSLFSSTLLGIYKLVHPITEKNNRYERDEIADGGGEI